MAVHAHPDDESTKGAATIARLSAEGVRTVLVTCTDGSAGDVTDRGLLEGRSLSELRHEELSEAAALLGFSAMHLLGHPDSGMAGDVEGAFASSPLEELVAELVTVIRAERPDVLVTYDPDYAAGHPDHARCLEVTTGAWSITSREPGGPRKLYGTRTHSPARLQAMHGWLTSHGQASPYETAAAAGSDRMTTRVEVGEYLETARRALCCHRSQVRPDEQWFFAVPTETLRQIFPWEDFQLLDSTVPQGRAGALETSLFERL